MICNVVVFCLFEPPCDALGAVVCFIHRNDVEIEADRKFVIDFVDGKNIAQHFRLVDGERIGKRDDFTLRRRHLSGDSL